MSGALGEELVAMEKHDQAERKKLEADGSLFDGYHPHMESIHRAHARRLREIINKIGWPTEELVGPDGAKAAWVIAQHSIGEPDFMRQCRTLLDVASNSGVVPRWQFAFIDDRIRVFEGKTQRFGTQLRGGPNGLEPHPLEDSTQVEQWRKEAGLPSLSEVLAQARNNPPPSPKNQKLADEKEYAWRCAVGWIS